MVDPPDRLRAGPLEDRRIDAGPAQELAREAGVPASTLVRGWIAHRLVAERNAATDTAAVIERLEADVRTLRCLVAP